MSEKQYLQIGEKFTEQYQVTMGQMFGKACLKTNNKAFSAFFKGEMVFKVGAEEANLLKDKYNGAVNWDPSGKHRAMKDWLQVPSDYAEDWELLAKQALDFVNHG